MPDQALIYQLVESTLKLNLDPKIAIQCINLVLETHPNLILLKSRVKMKQMNYKNYNKYKRTIKQFSKPHLNLKKEHSKKVYKPMKFINIQLENLLFNTISSDLDYHKIKFKENIDDLIFNALIHLKPELASL